MKSTKEIMRLSVIDNNTGEKIANIKDIIFSKKKLRILALLVSDEGIFKDGKIIRYKNIFNLGKDFIAIDKKDIIEKLKDFPEIEKAAKENIEFIGLKVIIKDGEILGYINDIIFNEKNGNLVGFVLTDGILQDIFEGRNIIPCMNNMKIIENTLILDKQFKDEYEKNKIYYKKLLDLDL